MEVDIDSLRSMIEASLPCRTRWTIKGTLLDHDFSRARAPLRNLDYEMSDYEISDYEMSDYEISEWSSHFVFGECDYAEGGGARPFLTIRSSDGSVFGFDPEREAALIPVNSSIERFIRTFRLLSEYVGKEPQLPLALADRVHEIDPEAYPASEWRLLIEYLTNGEQAIG